MTPLQMARFYAMIANGGKLVTPYVVADVEQPRRERPGAGRAAPLRARRRRGRRGRPRRAPGRPRRASTQATHASYGTSSGVFGELPRADRRQDGHGREGRAIPGYPAGHLEDQSWWCGYGPADDAGASSSAR